MEEFLEILQTAFERGFPNLKPTPLPPILFPLSQVSRWLLSLAHNLPSESPACRDWPRTPPALKETSFLLRKLYHKWRVCSTYPINRILLLLTKTFQFQCDRFRVRFDQTSRNRMREKVTASLIFKDRKSSYPRR